MLMYRNRSSVVFALAFGAGLSACAEPASTPVSPPNVPSRSSAARSPQPGQVRTLRDEFKEIAGKAPGFAGIWLDTAGNLVVSAASAEITPVMRAEVTRWLRTSGKSDLTTRNWRLHKVRYDYAALSNQMERAKAAASQLSGVNTFGVDVTTGRVLVGVSSAPAQVTVASALRALNIPDDALTVEVLPDAPDVQADLRSTFGAMGGAIQVAQGVGFCSIGFVGFLTDANGYPDTSKKVFTTAAHCMSSQLTMNGDVLGQPSMSRRVGVEIRLAQVMPQGSYFCGSYLYCRFADVALVAVDDAISINHGSVAISSATTSPNIPPFNGWRGYTGSGVTGAVVGETITRTGRTLGQQTGVVTQACMDRQSSNTPGMWTLCAYLSNASSLGGDSGGTVYIPYSSNNTTTPKAVGVLFQGGTNVTWFSLAGNVGVALGNDVYLYW